MAQYFVNHDELMKKKDFDDKVNTQNPLVIKDLDTLNEVEDLTGGVATGKFLEAFHDASESDLTIGNYGSGLLFGSSNTVGILNVHWGKHKARIIGAITNGGTVWSEDIAWKSDIKALQDRISALEKQIGGVLSRLLTHLNSHFVKMEVA